MKNSLKIAAFAFAMFGFTVAANAQDTESATSSATVVTPIAIAKAADMNFGNVAVTSQAGTVILAPEGTRTTGGGVTLPNVNGTVATADFNVTGQANYTYAITLPSTNYTISNTATGSTATMTVNAFTSSVGATGTLSAAGAQTIKIGATLNVSANQEAGSYTNATGFDVTVNYN